MKTTTSTWRRLSLLGLSCGAALFAGLARAVNDLPGGPAVNQLNLHAPVTQIGVEQVWLHAKNFILN